MSAASTALDNSISSDGHRRGPALHAQVAAALNADGRYPIVLLDALQGVAATAGDELRRCRRPPFPIGVAAGAFRRREFACTHS